MSVTISPGESEFLKINFLTKKYPSYEIITDIGSGINFKRKGLQQILDDLFEQNISEVVVASKDRFSRFGYELFEYIFNKFGAKITCVNKQLDQTIKEELAEDLLSIITVFTARYHGKRKYNVHQENKNIPN